MGRRVIRFSLSESEIDRAIRELNAYKQDLIRKAELLRQRVAEMISNEAQKGFNGAIVSDLIGDEARYPHVDVAVETSGKITLVIARNKEADSNDAMWVEFGAGVYHNGSAGSSPHPKGAELGFTIGGYGYGKGKRNAWGFYEDGELKFTHGAPAKMPMYNALKTVCDDIAAIAQEVFG